MTSRNFITFLLVFVCLNLFSQDNRWAEMGPFYGKSKSGEYMHSMGLVNAVLTNPKNDNEMIISTNSTGIWRSNDRGVIWNCVTDKEESWSKNWEYYRVLKSEDGGVSWLDYSQGLPTTPIFCLLRDERDENILFCGGDEGLYKCDNYYGTWKTWSNGLLKNVPFTDIKINYCQDKLYCSTYGRGVYGDYSSTALDYQDLTQDESWDSYRFVKRDIEILRGKTLTISADLSIASSTTITLHPKSTLIIDAATITSNCADKW